MMDKSYIETVRLLLESVPVIFETPNFAIKGGTAINLFVQNMPRLSVDILISLVSGEPDWQLMKCPHLQKMSAIQWKLQNLARLKKSNPAKFAQQADELRTRFAAKL